MKLSYAYIPSSDSGMDAMAKDKSSLARGQVEASVPTFSLIYIISLTWDFVGCLVNKVAYGAQLTLSVIATSNVLSLSAFWEWSSTTC